MLKSLHVRNYVLIDSLDIDFPEGLVIITGQTGAGKSIMIGALAMLSGGRADASVIGGHADSCVIEAVFDCGEDDAELRHLAESEDVEWDGGSLVVRRVISRSGRSRAFINDCPVPVQVLSSVSSHLLDIHSQHQTLLLSDRRFQLKMLDSFAGNSSALEDFRKLWETFNSQKTELGAVSDSIARSLAEKEYKETLFRQLDEAHLLPGELEDLEAEQKRLANAEEIKSALCGIESVFAGDQSENPYSVSSSLKGIQRSLEKLSSFLGEASSLSSRVESCRLELDDVYSEISGMNSSMDVSPERLQTVESRISLIYGLMQRHSCRSVEELIALKNSLHASISDLSSLQERKDALEKQIVRTEAALNAAAEAIHISRVNAAPDLSAAIREKLHFLELPFSVFCIDVLPDGMSSTGRDSVVFRFSATGKDPVEVSRCASGGELSRIMLSLKAVMSRFYKMPTMVFDEIDTGVSGSVADKMGSLICEMGKYMQVFAITHLPQVAAKGSAHYLVSKTVDPETSRAETTIERLSGERRVLEVARMLSGSTLTDAAIANAKALLKG